MSALRLINETTVSSTVSNISITNLFNNDFDIYKIVIDDVDCDTGNLLLYARYILDGDNVIGSDLSSTNYDTAALYIKSYNVFTEQRHINQTHIEELMAYSSNSSDAGGLVMYIFNPFNSSSYTFALYQSFGYLSSSGGLGFKGISVYKYANQITGINFFQNANNITNMKIRTYGLRVDNG